MSAAHLQRAEDGPDRRPGVANGSGRARSFEEWWAVVEPLLPAGLERFRDSLPRKVTPEFVARCKEKARRGWLEHGGGIVFMPDDELAAEVEGEVVDGTVYGAEQEHRRAL